MARLGTYSPLMPSLLKILRRVWTIPRYLTEARQICGWHSFREAIDRLTDPHQYVRALGSAWRIGFHFNLVDRRHERKLLTGEKTTTSAGDSQLLMRIVSPAEAQR